MMKKTFLFVISYLIFSSVINSQDLSNLDYVSPLHQEVVAVKKANQWGFVDKDGNMVIKFRDDLVSSSPGMMACCDANTEKNYPFFSNNRAMIKEIKEGISHYGFIDLTGKTAIQPVYLNATHFHNNMAIVIKMTKESLGKNEILGKNVISHSYNEVIIDSNGKVIKHLRGPFNLLYTKKNLQTPPKIESYFVGPKMVAVKNENAVWDLELVN